LDRWFAARKISASLLLNLPFSFLPLSCPHPDDQELRSGGTGNKRGALFSSKLKPRGPPTQNGMPATGPTESDNGTLERGVLNPASKLKETAVALQLQYMKPREGKGNL
jgi:hypothetical protein